METVFDFAGVVGNGGKPWGLPRDRHAEYRAAFPSLNLKQQYILAAAWLNSNPAQRKTPRGMPRFLFSWLERAQNGGRGGTVTPIQRPQADLVASTDRKLAAQRQVEPATREQLEELRQGATR